MEAHINGVCCSRCGKSSGTWWEGTGAETLTLLPAELQGTWIAGVGQVQALEPVYGRILPSRFLCDLEKCHVRGFELVSHLSKGGIMPYLARLL